MNEVVKEVHNDLIAAYLCLDRKKFLWAMTARTASLAATLYRAAS